eukprot:CAMPEP_0171309042 /NCGR_PEP_ID=MMETSP0816-20121228/19179_1 /TAXON_ID=420281 /ORGANISM="Proboscia inermis, Strain CCAP1064/1" /LENGTH=91 /DNA_ID=CAMNT_0011792309 /DNA_START=63 /DNA_END=338 /DNA_ORIENTATION=+
MINSVTNDTVGLSSSESPGSELRTRACVRAAISKPLVGALDGGKDARLVGGWVGATDGRTVGGVVGVTLGRDVGGVLGTAVGGALGVKKGV